MTDEQLERARGRMVELQIMTRGIKDRRLLEALRIVPRHLFVPESARDRAYDDCPLEIGHGQTISQPYIVALMTELLEVADGDSVLEVGAGSGYQTAILAELAGRVTSIERVQELAALASDRMTEFGHSHVTVLSGDGTLGCAEQAPYDAIIVTAAGPTVPEALKAQLREGGRLVCPVGPRDSQRLVRLVRKGDEFEEQDSIRCVFVPLIGEQGWQR
ncbi:MAG: protein-L-isoaspartate(D-aspartate) O-methyltransferase [bacterium]|nr:protein-L-isoaspartate(D-aspartate) O-methyltransferase [bacterium]